MEKTSFTQVSNQELCLRSCLRNEFLKRRKANPTYSLRAFAQFLKLDQSLLSKIMNGHRPLTANMVERLAPKLGIKPSQFQKMTQQNPLQNYNSLTDDQFNLLSEWRHFAILELSKTQDFIFNHEWMASRLGIHPEEVKDALARLERCGFIKIKGEQLKLLKPDNTWSSLFITNAARLELQKNLLEKAKVAIEQIPFEQRDNGSLTVAISRKRLPEFKAKLQQIRRELDAFFQPAGEIQETDEVYQLITAFYPLSKLSNKKGEEK